MINQQLLDYIKSQAQAGVARNEIKNALIDASWPEKDVDEAMQSNEKPASQTGATKVEPQIKISELISKSNFGLEPVSLGETKKDKSESVKIDLKAGVQKLNKTTLVNIVFAALAIFFAAASVYMYLKNTDLNSKINGNSQDQTIISQLNTQIDNLNQQISDLNLKKSSLTEENQNILSELSFFVSPIAQLDQESSFILKGDLSGGGKLPYVLTLADGLKLTVKNSKEIATEVTLKSLINQNVEISGKHIPGSTAVTVDAINGNPISSK